MYSADSGEEEGLFLSDSAGKLTPRLLTLTNPGSVTQNFTFIANKGDVFSACFKLVIADNEGNVEFSAPFPNDHPAAVTIEIEPA
jgi:hypothetical protein